MTEKPKRFSRLDATSSVLQSLLENGKTPLSHSYLCFRMAHEWTHIVGQKIGAASRPVSIDRGRVVIWVKSSVWAQELKFIEPELIQKMNDWKGEPWVKTLGFTQDLAGTNSIPEESFPKF